MQKIRQSGLSFMKMHGLGNDFVIVDARARQVVLSAALVRALGDRHRGVGFDQLAVVTAGQDVDAELTFYNSDGSVSATCGNATRCVARHLMEESGAAKLRFQTARGVIEAVDRGDGQTAVNLGPPLLHWSEIPLSGAMDTLELPVEGGPTATGLGNPHCTFFVACVEAIPLEEFGACHEQLPFYPERTNVQVAQITGRDRLRMRVWERGAGITLASGSSACATAVASARRGLTGRKVTVDMDGGSIEVDWRADGVWMTGGTTHVFNGVLAPGFLETFA